MYNLTPCDDKDNPYCPFDAFNGFDCRNYCGVGADESESENNE